MFLIQGCFFQNQEWLGARMATEGMVGVVEKGIVWDFFGGIIRPDPKTQGRFVGGLVDHYGESTLADVVVSDSRVSFLKKYDGREYEILHAYTVKDGESWVGEYRHPRVGRGITRCILTKVDDSFNDPEQIKKILGVAEIHTWE